MATTVEDAHQALMSSSPHRDNLLNASYNVAGLGVFRKRKVLKTSAENCHSGFLTGESKTC